jgi:ParB/RepB/Spo0J family partition protein
MITKSKTAKKPRTEKDFIRDAKRDLAKPPRAGLGKPMANEPPVAPPLTDVDREEAFALLWAREPDLAAVIVNMPDHFQASELVRRRISECVGPWRAALSDGMPVLSYYQGAEGVFVQARDRRGDLTWSDIVTRAHYDRVDEPAAAAPKRSRKPNVEPPANGHAGTTTPAGIAANHPEENAEPVRDKPTPNWRERMVPIDQIRVVEDANDRQHFDPAALEELAASIRTQGILQPLVAREPITGPLELIAGERRLRAAQLAGLREVPVRAALVSTDQAAEMRLIENLQREDLTAIEEARGFERLLKLEGGTHKGLAERLGLSESQVTNRLRLLKLPKKWQERILSRELPATHARSLATYAECPTILDCVEGYAFGTYQGQKCPVSLKDFDDLLDDAVREVTDELVGDHYCGHLGKRVPRFTPTPEQRAQLGIITVVTKGQGKKAKEKREERATNTKLWRELQEAHEKTLAGKKHQRDDAKAAAAKKKSPAEQRALAQQQAASLRKWIADWRTDWLRRILSETVVDDRSLALHTVVMGIAYGDGIDNEYDRVLELIEPRTAGFKGERAIAADTDEGTVEVLVQLAADWLWNDEQAEKDPAAWRGRRLDADAVEALAESAKIDLAAQWAGIGEDSTLCQPQAFFERHTTAGLQSLCKELGAKTLLAKKGDLVHVLLNSPATWKRLPKAIAPVAAPTKKAKAKR